ncbi:YheC/YheD family protein [Cohnella sp.]|uniref:YheC/YheD family protein n=1 Tax=Cohnella sp. TaxID=1883426 RepID=UPI00356A501C
MPQHVGSKWRKTSVLLQSRSLQNIVPRTVRFNRNTLMKMLQHYGMVYIKPDKGRHGKGVFRVERANGQYRFQAGKVKRNYHSYLTMFQAIRKETKGRSYLVQRGIHLLKYKGRRFDLRVMVQLNPRRKWETTGIIGRVAAPGKVVTNYHNGGTPMSANRLLGRHLSKSAVANKVRFLEKMGVKTGKVMRKAFSGVSEIGVDIGLDHSLTPWIIEVNTSPDPFIFRKLPDPAVFRKIRRYAQVYGRL